MIRVIDVFDISGTNKTLITLKGDTPFCAGKGHFIQKDAVRIEVDSLPMMGGAITTSEPNELTVGVLDNVLRAGDIVTIT